MPRKEKEMPPPPPRFTSAPWGRCVPKRQRAIKAAIVRWVNEQDATHPRSLGLQGPVGQVVAERLVHELRDQGFWACVFAVCEEDGKSCLTVSWDED